MADVMNDRRLPKPARLTSFHEESTSASDLGRDSFNASPISRSPRRGFRHDSLLLATKPSSKKSPELPEQDFSERLAIMSSFEYAEPSDLASLLTVKSEPVIGTITDEIVCGSNEMVHTDSEQRPRGFKVSASVRNSFQRGKWRSDSNASSDAVSVDDYTFTSIPERSSAPDEIYEAEQEMENVQAPQKPQRRKWTYWCIDDSVRFHGDHELRRHLEQHHSVFRTDSVFRTVWVCCNPPDKPGSLDSCKVCRNGKSYGASYNAAAHLRRAHFYPCKNKRGGRNKKSEGRGGIGGGNEPSMDVLKHYMYKRLECNVSDSNIWEFMNPDEPDRWKEAAMLDRPPSGDLSPRPPAMPKPSVGESPIVAIGVGSFREVSKDHDSMNMLHSIQGSSKACADTMNGGTGSSISLNVLPQTQELSRESHAHLPSIEKERAELANVKVSTNNTDYQASWSDNYELKLLKVPSSSNVSDFPNKSACRARDVSAPSGPAREDQLLRFLPKPAINANSRNSIYSGLAPQHPSRQSTHPKVSTPSWFESRLYHIKEVEEFSPAAWFFAPIQNSLDPMVSPFPFLPHEPHMLRSLDFPQTDPYSAALFSARRLPPLVHGDATEAVAAQNSVLRECSVQTADSGYYSQQDRLTRHLSEEMRQSASSETMLAVTRGSPFVPDVTEILNMELVSKSTQPYVDITSKSDHSKPSKQNMRLGIMNYEESRVDYVAVKEETTEQKPPGNARACEPCKMDNRSCYGSILCCTYCSDNNLKCQYGLPDDSSLKTRENAKVPDICRQPLSYMTSMLDSFGFREAPPRFESWEISSEPVTETSSPLEALHDGSPFSKIDSTVDSDGERSFIDGMNDRDCLLDDEIEIVRELTTHLALITLKSFTNRVWHAGWYARPSASGASSTGGSSKSSQKTSTSLSTSTLASKNSSGKRPCSSDNDPDDLDNTNDGRGAKRPCRVSRRNVLEKQLFACPYHRYDRERYSTHNTQELCYRVCSRVVLRDISRLKQHLYRVHRRPDYYCGSCYRTFDTQEGVDMHTRKRPACENQEPLFQEKMTKDQMKAIKGRSVRTEPHAEWFKIYRILFPQAVVPPNSYAYADRHSAAAMQDFLAYFECNAPRILSGHLCEYVRDHQLLLSQHTQDILDEAFVYATSRLLAAVRPGIQVLGLQNGESPPEHRQLEERMQAQAVADTGAVTQHGLASDYTFDFSDLDIDISREDPGWLLNSTFTANDAFAIFHGDACHLPDTIRPAC